MTELLLLGIAESGTCGRPTRSGKPCKTRISYYEQACRLHATEYERAVTAALRKVYLSASSEAYERGVADERRRAETQRRREEERRARWRTHTPGGDQIVQVSGGYANVWRGPGELRLGDRVLLPGNWLYPEPCEDVVTGFGTDYAGELSTVVKLIERAADRPNATGVAA